MGPRFAVLLLLLLSSAKGIRIDLFQGDPESRRLDTFSAAEEESGSNLSRGLRNYENLQYYGFIGFGKDSKGNINWRPVIFDTGSSMLWTSEDGCNCTGGSKDRINVDNISSWSSSGKTLKLAYGKGGTEGIVGTLHAYFSGSEYATDQSVLLASQASMPNGPTSGILGLSQSAGSPGYPPLLYQLKTQSKINSLLFTVSLRKGPVAGNDGSYIKLGEVSTEGVLEGQEFYYVPLESSELYDNYYCFKLGRMAIGDLVSMDNYIGVADTGTSLMNVPIDFLKSLVDSYGRDKCGTFDEDNFIACRCDSVSDIPDMTIQIGTQEWTLPSSQFVLYQDGKCVFLTQPPDAGNLVILGDIFLQNVVTVFDLEEKQIGFASNVDHVAPKTKTEVKTTGISGNGATQAVVSFFAALTCLILY